jgi:hypothetical protein
MPSTTPPSPSYAVLLFFSMLSVFVFFGNPFPMPLPDAGISSLIPEPVGHAHR